MTDLGLSAAKIRLLEKLRSGKPKSNMGLGLFKTCNTPRYAAKTLTLPTKTNNKQQKT